VVVELEEFQEHQEMVKMVGQVAEVIEVEMVEQQLQDKEMQVVVRLVVHKLIQAVAVEQVEQDKL
tara:strand:+ start:122 stop:316 length:195 start_codon:yes stop_codon:yes gene_type:complete